MRAAASAVIIVFARAPRAGQAKTRLAPRVGAAAAARLQARLTFAALRTAREARCGPVELHLTARHSLFRGTTSLRLQRGPDLGWRMHHALAQGLRRHGAAILIGADCPALRPEDLRRALRLLAGGCDVVLAPAEDGGYALIAARRVSPLLFEGVPWGGASVYAETLRRLARLGYRARELRTVWDVDRPEDLERLRSLRFASALPRGARRSRDSRARWGGSGRP